MKKKIVFLGAFICGLWVAYCAFSCQSDGEALVSPTPTPTVTPTPIVQIVYETVEVLVEKELPMTSITQIDTNNLEEAITLLNKAKEKLETTQMFFDSSISLYGAEHPVPQLAQTEIQHAEQTVKFYEEIVIELQKAQVEAEKRRLQDLIDNGEYPIAARVWYYMKYTLGWNDYVCAGVMGNLMSETGGQTLKLNPHLYFSHDGNTYYGICQWSNEFYPQIHGKDLDAQLKYLNKTVESEFESFGRLYAKGFTYTDFTNLTNEREAALAFTLVYERCGPESHKKRQDNAEKALQYFAPTLGEEQSSPNFIFAVPTRTGGECKDRNPELKMVLEIFERIGRKIAKLYFSST